MHEILSSLYSASHIKLSYFMMTYNQVTDLYESIHNIHNVITRVIYSIHIYAYHRSEFSILN